MKFYFYMNKNGKNWMPENPVLKEIVNGILLADGKLSNMESPRCRKSNQNSKYVAKSKYWLDVGNIKVS